ncbi:phosphoserine phosphatase SerB [Methanotrichaceae archaeon M04Ac]|uniref:phosphoserine phosphatase n=1 Tax=Candidatus Methanocrinis alkalitolerans TaxID=3033395 RepID=A0ABT5XH45_9EURY|nr:phosphoserine phosphatase SerB [Candidatus Methanocrinis alkalitolerans]MCR3882962.1 phosphoserine phosphatase SerB [Methanothrix sp.]MDF0593987.1 phosphoserine phosphatase SerB [Candidatus Methanocrinis alkalitolerans]
MAEPACDFDLWVISVLGKDRPGIICDLLEAPAKMKVNIVDLDQRILQGRLVMSMVADFGKADATPKELEAALQRTAADLGVEVSFLPIDQYRGKRMGRKNLHVVTILARDRVGIIYDVATLAAERGVNIEKALVTARGELISIEFVMDFGPLDAERLRGDLKAECEKLGLDVVVQSLDKSRKERRLIVFDMDSTIVDFETINQMASFAGVDREVEEITMRAMNGELDFEEALRSRVRLLKGTPEGALEEIAKNIQLTPGSEELIHHLKEVGYKTALISGGFTYFTDILKERLGFDYTFANVLEIRDGVLTGEIEGEIIDGAAKGRIVNDLAGLEGISSDGVVAVGDGANDCLMIQNAGLGVAFNAKEILKKVSDGSLSKENLIGLLNVLGLADKGGDLL